MAQSAKVLNRIFYGFELKTLSNVIFYARSNGVKEIFIFATVFEIHSLQRRYFSIFD